MRTAIQFGAGKIGRGFMGQLFWEGGYHTWFVEYDRRLVESLEKRKSYPLKLLDAYSAKEIDLEINNLNAIQSDDMDRIASLFTQADVIGTAVGVRNLESIAPAIARGIIERKAHSGTPIDIYLCENVEGAGNLLKKQVCSLLDDEYEQWAQEHIGFVSTSVARMVPAASERFAKEDPLFVVADSYHKLPYDEKARRADLPAIEGLVPVMNFEAELARKLFTYNLGHAVLGYLGYLKGLTYVHETFEDPDLVSIFNKALQETAKALMHKYPEDIKSAEQEAVLEDINVRYGNPMVADSLTRVAQDPLRKLGPNDRLIGSAKLCLEFGIFPEAIATACGAAYAYDFPEDVNAVKLQKIIRDKGIEEAVLKVSQIDPNGELGQRILHSYHEFSQHGKNEKEIEA